MMDARAIQELAYRRRLHKQQCAETVHFIGYKDKDHSNDTILCVSNLVVTIGIVYTGSYMVCDLYNLELIIKQAHFEI